MTKIGRYSLVCSNCKCNFRTRLYDSINITLDPHLLKLVYEGKFNVAACPKCKNKSYVPKWFLFHDMQKRLLIEVFPEQINQFIKFLLNKKYFKEIGNYPHYVNTISIFLSNQQSKSIWRSIVGWFNSFLNKKLEMDQEFNKIKLEDYPPILDKKQKKIVEGLTAKEIRKITQQQILQPSKDIKAERESAIGEISVTRKKFEGFCEFCKKEVNYTINRFYCNYCYKWHCEKHRLPEEHGCSGKPKAPPGAFRELHTRRGITVIGK